MSTASGFWEPTRAPSSIARATSGQPSGVTGASSVVGPSARTAPWCAACWRISGAIRCCGWRPPPTRSAAGSATRASLRDSGLRWSASSVCDRRLSCLRLRNRLLAAVVAFVLLAVWFVHAGTLLIASEPPVAADAIVVLAGNAPSRLVWAEQLRDAGYADLLVVSNEPIHTHGLETTWLALHRAGVASPDLPDSALLVIDDPPPESTIEEARRSADMLVIHGLHSALLVTESFHSRRASMLFEAAYAHRGLSVRSVPVPDKLDLAHWCQHPLSARRVTEEWTKMAYYLVKGA